MLAALAAALLQPSAPPAPPPELPADVNVWPDGIARPESRPPAPPPGPRRDIAVDTAYALLCRVTAEDGAPFELKAKAAGRGAERRMAVESSAPDRFPSGTAEAGQAHTRNWPADDYVEIFTLDRKDAVYTLTLGWAAGRLTDAALTTLRPTAAQPFGSPGAILCRQRE